jgi:hypothetical protein
MGAIHQWGGGVLVPRSNLDKERKKHGCGVVGTLAGCGACKRRHTLKTQSDPPPEPVKGPGSSIPRLVILSKRLVFDFLRLQTRLHQVSPEQDMVLDFYAIEAR